MGKKRADGEGGIRKRKDDRWEGVYTASYDPATGNMPNPGSGRTPRTII